MAYFALSNISGCTNPSSGETSSEIFGVQYNDAKIISYFKKNKTIDNILIFIVVCKFENYTQQYQFLDADARDAFYLTLP